jgi:hypothetical protein
MYVPGRRTAALALAVVVTLLTAACTASPSAPDRPVDVVLTLAPGQAQAVAGTPLTVRFVGVTGDSRCPADAVCILGGSATVVLEVSSGGVSQRLEVQTAGERPATYGRFTLSLRELSPFPFSARPIAPEEYRATLRITG